MTNAIEQTKREMYRRVSALKWACNEKPIAFEQFEVALEAHLEDLRQDAMDTLGRLAAMTEERDSTQLRLHAVDHAYREQQRKAGTYGQVCEDRGASEQPDANMAVVMSALRGAQNIMVEYLVPDGIRAKRAMTKLVPLLDNEKLYSALYEIEHEKT